MKAVLLVVMLFSNLALAETSEDRLFIILNKCDKGSIADCDLLRDRCWDGKSEYCGFYGALIFSSGQHSRGLQLLKEGCRVGSEFSCESYKKALKLNKTYKAYEEHSKSMEALEGIGLAAKRYEEALLDYEAEKKKSSSHKK